jgi:hypothetical protein
MSHKETVTGHGSVNFEFPMEAEIDEYNDVAWPDGYSRTMARSALRALAKEYNKIRVLIDDQEYNQAGRAMDWDNLDPYRHDPQQDPTTEGEPEGDDASMEEGVIMTQDSAEVVDLTPA